MQKLSNQSKDISQENIKKVEELFPNCVTETYDQDGNLVRSIDFDILRQDLSDHVVEGPKERYQFNWPGKREAILLANAPTTNTLRPLPEKSVDFENTKNVYIEGDNLEALKILRETYMGKIKMIYIDPPYNTGNDFVYKDDFKQSTEEYLKSSGDIDEEGNRMEVNGESNGRFHSDWLNMMYPRLVLARDLLTDDGLIFMSIDDNEQDNLVRLGKEIFGESNFVATFPWRKRTAKSDVPFGVSQDFEWVLCFAKSSQTRVSIEGKERKYFETDDFPGRPWRIHDLTKQTTASERPNSYFTIVDKKRNISYPANPNRTWRVSKDTFSQYDAENRIVYPGDYPFLKISQPVLRYWKEDDQKKDGELFGRVALSTLFPQSVGRSQDGSKDVFKLFQSKVFSYPKPVSLIKFLIYAATKDGDIIADFFSGSATTAEAVFSQNFEDNGHRRFLMVQLPEPTGNTEASKNGFSDICGLAEERIRRAGRTFKDENPLTAMDLDIGFRVYKTDSSNMKDVQSTPQNTQISLLENADSAIKVDRTPLDLVIQVMLQLGITLDANIKKGRCSDGAVYYLVNNNDLLCCFDKAISESDIEEMAKLQPLNVAFSDDSFASDQDEVNCEQIFKTLSPITGKNIFVL